MTGRSSQVARGLNTIAAHIVKNKDELLNYGIAVEDSNGNLKSTYEVLSELKPLWDSLGESERVALGQTLSGGVNQYKVLAAVMKNFSTATEATTAALNSSGSAAKENARYMESIEARVTAVKAAFQQMSTAVVDSDLVKGILDIGKGLAEFGSTDIGAAITQITLLSGVSWGGLQLLGQSILPGIIKSFETFASVVNGASLASVAASAGITTLKAGLAASLPVILAVVAAIVALVAIIKGIKEAYDKANPSVEQAAANMKSSQEELESVSKASENAKQKLEELNKTKFEDRTSEIQAEIDRLQALVSYYEAVIDLRNKERNESVQAYTSAVEREGFDTKQYTAYGHISNLDEDGVSYGVKQFEQAYNSLEEAIIRAAAAEAEFNNNIIDVTNISAARQELENLGWSFTENTISTKNAESQMFGYLQQLQHGKELTPAMADGISDLLKQTYDYANALTYLKDNGVELNQEQKEFLFTYQALYDEALKATESASSMADSNNAISESAQAAADALGNYAQQLLNAANAYQTFKERLAETGDYDDSFKGLSSLLGEITGEMEKGQYESRAMQTALELLTGQTFEAGEAQQYLNDNYSTLTTLFGDAESGGLGLIAAMQQLSEAGDTSWGSISEVNGELQISIESFSALADSLGISEGALFTLTEAARIFGVDFQYTAQDVLSSINGLSDGIVTVQGDITHIDFAQFVHQMKDLGRSNEEIKTLQQVLEHTSDVKLDNVNKGLSLLKNGADSDKQKIDELNGSLEDIESFDASGAVGQFGTLKGAISAANSAASALAATLSSIDLGSFAEGTNYAKEGPSLVNEEGPELIQSGGKAYIAGGGLPTITHLHEGDRVFTAEETKDILKGNKFTGVIQAHARQINPIGEPPPPKSTSPINGITTATTTIGKDAKDALDEIINKIKGDNKPTGKGSGGGGGGKSSSSSKSSSTDEYKEEFDTWLKAKKHALAMDEIAEEEYYNDLEKMNEKYFKDREEYQDEYWKYEEEVYKWRKKQEEKAASDKEKADEEAAREAEKLAQEQAKAYKAEFDSWLADKKHMLAMDEITEEEYYKALQEMNDKYFKGRDEYQDDYRRHQEAIYSWQKKQEEAQRKAEEQAAKDAEKAAEDALKAHKNEFTVWLKEQDHMLSLDLISEEQYYAALEKMNDKYFKDREEFQDEYWKYEEKIYAWKKKKAEQEAKEQEEAAEKALKDQIELEKKLNNLEIAKASKVKVFQNGQFRYVSDREALAKAQEALSSYGSGTLSAVGGMSLVGENGPELRVLNSGDGIIPYGFTKNLMAWGAINPDTFKNSSSDMYNFDISNLTLPDIRNAHEFVTGLKSFALQYVGQRGN